MHSFPFSSYLAFLCAATFYMYQFVLRVSPSVMVSDMMLSFSTDAAGISLLSSVSLYAYSFMQIPAGIFADVWGPRRLILLSIFLCVLGSFLVATTPYFSIAILGRIIIGIGSASAFLSVAKVALAKFGSHYQPLFFGFTMAAGTIGALNGGNTIAFLLEFITWQETLLLLCGIGFLVALFNFYGLTEKSITSQKKKEHDLQLSNVLSSILTIFKSGQCWISAFVALGIYSTISVVADLWGVSFCMQVYHLPRVKAAHLVSLLYVGLCIGSIVIPYVSYKFSSQKKIIIGCLIGLFINLFLLFFLSKASLFLKGVFFFNIGFFSGAEMVCFAYACSIGSSQSSGTITGFINAAVMMGGAFLQYLFGIILTTSWEGIRDAQGAPIYPEQGYYMAFALILGTVLLSLFSSFFLFSSFKKEKSVSVKTHF
ncbi:MAG: MFS transporter [Proteobacteria bacterium]|nr:MFS transporter [Pseudomonadota bacterium]